ncbi:site-2 protease family protein [bacterium]|nr:site-2 protease family protein [bacterium]MBU4561564.1 site-2 protease family protein [bacterium]MCG2676303.1 site-2 protease family protein [bacterium]MCG2678098.1 site-2 protease family protein [bacterium]
MAERRGDPTARLAGRITLNPIPHIDLMGTIVLPLFLIIMGSRYIVGWPKPVPVDFHNLRNPKQDMIWIALAGPASNIILAVLCVLIFRINIINSTGNIGLLLCAFILINFLLAFFNLIPIPPLDGSRILMGLLPPQQAYSYSRIEPFGLIIIFSLFILGFLNSIFVVVVRLSLMLGIPDATIMELFRLLQ